MHNRARYFKREITPMTRWYASYLLLPPRFGRTLGLRPIALSIPEDKIVPRPTTKDQDFASHIVDHEVAARLGATTRHVFAREGDYYADLQRSRFGITTSAPDGTPCAIMRSRPAEPCRASAPSIANLRHAHRSASAHRTA